MEKEIKELIEELQNEISDKIYSNGLRDDIERLEKELIEKRALLRSPNCGRVERERSYKILKREELHKEFCDKFRAKKQSDICKNCRQKLIAFININCGLFMDDISYHDIAEEDHKKRVECGI